MNGALICTLEIALLTVTRKGSVQELMGLGYAVLASSYLLFFAGSTIAVFTAVMIAFTLGEMFAFSRQSAYMASLSHEEMRGRYSGFLSLSWCIGSSSGAILGLRIYGENPAFLWVLCSTFGILAAVCVIAAGRKAPDP